MTNELVPEGADNSAPIELTLPPARNGYRRKLWRCRELAAYFDRQPPNEWLSHQHEHLQITLVLDRVGYRVRWQTADATWHEKQLTGPNVLIVPAMVPHMAVWPNEGDVITLYFSLCLVRQILKDERAELTLADLIQLAARDKLIVQLAEAFRPLCSGREHPSYLYVESISNVLGTHILRALFKHDVPPDNEGGLPADSIRRVRVYIEKNLTSGYDSAKLAKVAGFSRNHFLLLFGKSFGMTPRRYFRECQVAYAEALLVTTDRKIIEIAGEAGFASSGMMVKWFHVVLGRTPSNVRRRRTRS